MDESACRTCVALVRARFRDRAKHLIKRQASLVILETSAPTSTSPVSAPPRRDRYGTKPRVAQGAPPVRLLVWIA